MKIRKRVNYGIVGCGNVFWKHAEAIARNDESALFAVCDIDEKRAKEAAHACRSSYTDFDSMLVDQNIDAVVICTPHDTHKDLILRTIKAGKYCIAEKPIVLSSSTGRGILKSRHYKKNVFTVFQIRFNPEIKFLLSLVQTGALGKIRLCSVKVRKWRDDDYFRNGWRDKLERAGGMLFTHGIHGLDLMHMICGDPRKIYALSKNPRPFKEIEDIYLANVEFKNGAFGNIEVTTYAKHQNLGNSIFVAGDGGSIKIGGPAFNVIEHLSLGKKAASTIRRSKDDTKTSHGRFISAVNDFILRGKRDPLLPFAEDGLQAVSFIEKLYHALDNKS